MNPPYQDPVFTFDHLRERGLTIPQIEKKLKRIEQLISLLPRGMDGLAWKELKPILDGLRRAIAS